MAVDTWILIPALLASGALAGVLSGLLGIGGGIVMTPVLYFAFSALEIGELYRMQLAVGTSLAIVIPTTISSARAHGRRGSIDLALIGRWAVPLVVGAIAGALLGASIASETLRLIFAVLATIMGIKLILPLENVTIGDHLPGGVAGTFAPAAIGVLSSLMGIGGATFSVPYMTLFGIPIHRAVGTAAGLGAVIGAAGALSYGVAGLGLVVETATVGFVHWPAFLLVAPVSLLAAPYGARLAHALSRRLLSVIFGLFLVGTGLRLAIGG